MAVLVTWLSNNKSHKRSHNILVTFSENGRQYGFVSRDSVVPLEHLTKPLPLGLLPSLSTYVVAEHNCLRRFCPELLVQSRKCHMTLTYPWQHRNSHLSGFIFPYVNRTAISHMRCLHLYLYLIHNQSACTIPSLYYHHLGLLPVYPHLLFCYHARRLWQFLFT